MPREENKSELFEILKCLTLYFMTASEFLYFLLPRKPGLLFSFFSYTSTERGCVTLALFFASTQPCAWDLQKAATTSRLPSG